MLRPIRTKASNGGLLSMDRLQCLDVACEHRPFFFRWQAFDPLNPWWQHATRTDADAGFRVLGLGFTVWGLGFRALG